MPAIGISNGLGIGSRAIVASAAPAEPFNDYTFPLLSVRADTGDAGDWTSFTGTLAQKDSTAEWVVSTNSAKGLHYQEFAALTAQHGVIDEGNAVVDLSHEYLTFNSDADDAIAFVEFYDASDVFLGNHQTTSVNPNDLTEQLVANCPVPPGTRTFRIGWQGMRLGGTELSAFVRDLACTIKTRTVSPWSSAAVALAEFEANMTNLTSTLETIEERDYINHGQFNWLVDASGYIGGSSANSRAEKPVTLPAGWAAKIASGNVRALVRAQLSNANGGDDAGIGLRFNNGSTNPVSETGRTHMGRTSEFVARDMAVPSDTTSIDLLMEFWRDDGTVCDALIQKVSVLLYETGGA